MHAHDGQGSRDDASIILQEKHVCGHAGQSLTSYSVKKDAAHVTAIRVIFFLLFTEKSIL